MLLAATVVAKFAANRGVGLADGKVFIATNKMRQPHTFL
jgi:hypothetical protein